MTSQKDKLFETPRKASLFEEKFPELHNWIPLTGEIDKIDWNPQYLRNIIQKYCLDKSFVIQQIKETFNKYFTEHYMGTPWCKTWRKEIEQELLERLEK